MSLRPATALVTKAIGEEGGCLEQIEIEQVNCAIAGNRPIVHYTKPNNVMKTLLRFLPVTLLAMFFMLTMTSCDAIGSIFKAGAYTGIIGVIIVVAVAIWLISKLFGGGGSRNS